MGLRIGELCALKWSDIDFKKGILTINKTILDIKKLIPLHAFISYVDEFLFWITANVIIKTPVPRKAIAKYIISDNFNFAILSSSCLLSAIYAATSSLCSPQLVQYSSFLLRTLKQFLHLNFNVYHFTFYFFSIFYYSIIISSKQIKQIKQNSKSQKHRLLYQYSKLNNELKTTQYENNGIRRIWAQSWRYVVG